MVLAGAEGFVSEAGSFTCFVFCNESKCSLVFIVCGESDLLRAHQNKPPLSDTSRWTQVHMLTAVMSFTLHV